ncbi:MAG: hypothetical protein ACXAEN_13755, partial [Candidatus Thorarchaeota archaeon]
DSFDNASKWLVEAYKNMGKLPPTVIVGNKTDLRPGVPEKERVTADEGQKFTEYFVEKLDVPAIFKETSALTGYNIEDTFEQLLGMMSKAEENKESDIFVG